MKLYDELKARGLVAQITDEEIIDVINEGKATFYIGFDCTADSLTAGHFMALTLMKRLQMAGNKPIALIGGGTTMIGDPSGRTDMRKMLTKEDIDHNAACFKRQMERFIDFSEGKALMLNNADWLLKLNYIELLREVGRLLLGQQYAARRVLQAADGKGPVLPRVQLHDHAELRLLLHVPALRLQHAVRRRRPVEQHAGRHRADPQAGQGRLRLTITLLTDPGQEDGQDRRQRSLAGPQQDQPPSSSISTGATWTTPTS